MEHTLRYSTLFLKYIFGFINQFSMFIVLTIMYYPVGKITEKAVCGSVVLTIWHCIIIL